MTFSEVADSLREEWQLRSKRKELSRNAVEEYLGKHKILEKHFGKKLLCKMKEEEILEFWDDQIFKNRVVTSNRYVAVTKFVFKHGLELNSVIEDPAINIKLLSEKDHERKVFLLPNNLDKLIVASKEIKAKYYLPAIILLKGRTWSFQAGNFVSEVA